MNIFRSVSNSHLPLQCYSSTRTTIHRRIHGVGKRCLSNIARKPSTAQKIGLIFSVTISSGFLINYAGYMGMLHAEAIQLPTVEESDQLQAKSLQKRGDILSSSQIQAMNGWEYPGVYAWGNNTGRVIEDSDEPFVKTAKRIPYFDGKLFRDMKLDQNFGAAIAENGDLIQWGKEFSSENWSPSLTLRGKDLIKLAISKDRILALSSNGEVYSISPNQTHQITEPHPEKRQWFQFWKSFSDVGYRRIEPKNLSWGEKITDISSGMEHGLLLTSKGRVFSVASAFSEFPSKGQLGIPDLTWKTRPTGHFDQPHEIKSLDGFEITKIATGDYHSLVLDKAGRVFSFGDNSHGQLGNDLNSSTSTIDVPSLLPLEKLYKGTNMLQKVSNIAAGGKNSFFMIDSIRKADKSVGSSARSTRITADTWSCGQGILGSLGNGRWTHIQDTPTKINSLSGLFEYDEERNVTIPIRVAKLSVGATHVSAVLNNITNVQTENKKKPANDTVWGADVLLWGGNEFYQLGTAKRSNSCQPVSINPLDTIVSKDKVKKHRFQIMPPRKTRWNNMKSYVEQELECGRGITAVYWKA
ncbi:Bgt-85 [Blumeria graminis f. sp. tritici]|uniref:Bgt-85 n=2 Tax=Blumeria graminis f. sp. tritici TaxID=62690 RepID=A0A381L790_BLUGR|nr:hypothetical protein BGT96224_85 [Blumeria graminis f. sp. tritici 96224]VDB83715.1 Bgt-85 [Blumeria graminis f. sp. tritici]